MVIGIIFLFLVGVFSGCVEEAPKIKSNTIYVDDDGTADFISIQDAINASNDDDFIYVSKGTYYESLTINKSINLIGEDKNTTIISGRYADGIYPLISLEADNCSIQKFTFTNGTNPHLDGISLTRSSENTITNNNIIGFNQGIYLMIFSDRNTISDNFISNNQYGIRIKGGDYNNISKNNIKNNNRGVYCCCGAEYNEIHFNNFFENYEYNGIESSSLMNYWDNNYWDDYIGKDEDNDGYGDNPYDIASGTDKDSKPLMNPFG